MTDDQTDLMDSLMDILEKERAALVLGDLDRIARLTDAKENLISALQKTAPEATGLERVQAQLSRNQTLLHSAISGIRAATQRLADVRRVRSSLDTYDHHGRKLTSMEGQASSIERRA